MSIVDAVTEKSADKLGKRTPELVAQTEIDANLASIRVLLKEEIGREAIESSIEEILQENWVRESGVTKEMIAEWIFGSGSKTDSLSGDT